MIYQLYDEDLNPDVFASRRMGVASIPIDTLHEGQLEDMWLDFIPNIAGDTVSGKLHVSVLLSPAEKPGFELAMLCVGVLLSFGSLISGFYVWKAAQKRPTLVEMHSPRNFKNT